MAHLITAHDILPMVPLLPAGHQSLAGSIHNINPWARLIEDRLPGRTVQRHRCTVMNDDQWEVLTGTHGDLEWSIVVSGTTADLMTMLETRERGRRVSASGFGGPALYPDRLVNEWRGRSGDRAWFVMARTDPSVSRLTAQTDSGLLVELAMSEPDPRTDLKYAAAGLPAGEAPGILLVEVEGQPITSIAQPVPPSQRRS